MVTCENKGKEMREIEFKVKFITPLLIGGSQQKYRKEKYEWKIDEGGLNGKALRGCWRFWCRAVIGGIVKEIDDYKIKELESQIFGSADIDIGSKFRMYVTKNSNFGYKKFELGFQRKYVPVKKDGYYPETSYSVKIIPRKTMSETEEKILISSIWLWGNLGSIGSRSRRGFGSPVISPVIISNENSENPFSYILNGKKIDFPAETQIFLTTEALENHLKQGLSSIGEIFEYWIQENEKIDLKNLKSNLSRNHAPKDSQYFVLRSSSQILVGKSGYEILEDAISAVHGQRNCKGMGWAAPEGKMASPVFFRFHKVYNEKESEIFLPVVTWCKQRKIREERYGDCALNYLKRMEINNQRVFTNYLSGVTL